MLIVQGNIKHHCLSRLEFGIQQCVGKHELTLTSRDVGLTKSAQFDRPMALTSFVALLLL